MKEKKEDININTLQYYIITFLLDNSVNCENGFQYIKVNFARFLDEYEIYGYC